MKFPSIRCATGKASGDHAKSHTFSSSVVFQPGEEIAGRYRVIRALGEGGMGAVYQVERTTDRRRFALKVLAGARSGPTMARFSREAQLLSKFNHPNLVGVADVDVDPYTATLY